MRIFAALLGLFLCSGVVLDAFQTVILPRRATGRFRITRLFYLMTWSPWVALGARIGNRKVRGQFYSIYGPLSLLLLLALWAILLTLGFALLMFAAGTAFLDVSLPPSAGFWPHLATDLYVSGTSFATLGPGDVVPRSQMARSLMSLESGMGLGFVALVISYVPVLYGAFSQREVIVTLLDARAGSPPTAAELLGRHGFEGGRDALVELLAEWERWSAEILESHISHPVLCYYRSQHDNQSWLAALTTIMDACTLLITTVLNPEAVHASRQAQLTFAMGRHALIDLAHIFGLEPEEAKESKRDYSDRLKPAQFRLLCETLSGSEIQLCEDPTTAKRLLEMRALYEPQACALSNYLKMSLPEWVSEPRTKDGWHKVAGLRVKRTPRPGEVRYVSERAAALRGDEHGF